MLLFGFIMFLFENVRLLHVFFAHGFFIAIENKLFFEWFLVLENYFSKKEYVYH